MQARHALLSRSLTLLVVALVCGWIPADASARPNIVLIMADDMGYECVRANGGQTYQTPNLAQLAAKGVRSRISCVR